MKHIDPERSALYLDRARKFAPRFVCWFEDGGEALPYGRSLSYRFAQVAFFSAMALAGLTTEQLGWGELKGLLLRNLRNWLARPIITSDGLLSIGYGYPNLIMGEGYNAPGSPYWALKVFACLALPQDHPFWTSEERPMPPLPDRLLEPHARMLITRSASGHVQAFAAGNHANQHAHDEAKYEKFVYSTHFAFSVPKGLARLGAGAFDSVLALSLDGCFYHPRYGCDAYEVLADCVRFLWQPFPGVRVESEVRPFGDWHLRTHTIQTDQLVRAAEGGFAIQTERGKVRSVIERADVRVVVHAPWGISGIVAIEGYETAQCVIPEPNTNLLYPRTLLPTLTATIKLGKARLVCAVLGTPKTKTIWQEMPEEVLRHARMGK